MRRVLVAVLRRDWQIERTYHLRLLLAFTDTVVVAIGLYFVGKLVTDPDVLGGYDVSYFDFAIVGLAVNAFAGVGLQGFSSSLGREQSTGTIDLLLTAPAPRGALVGGMYLLPFAFAVAEIAALLGFGAGVVGSGLPLGGVVLSIPVLLLTMATFAAVGIASAGVLLVAKRGDPFSGPFYQLNLLLSGAIFPLGVLPGWVQGLAHVVPATYGVRATRDLLLADAGWADVAPDVLVLAGFSIVLLPLGMLFLRSCIGLARREGLLGSH